MIIGVCGLAGSGKDTVADFFVSHGPFVKVAFADPLKRICQDVYKFTDQQLWGPSQYRNAPDKRYLRERAGKHGVSDVRSFCRDVRPVPPGHFDAWPSLKGKEHLVTSYGSDDNWGFLPSPPEDVYLTPRYALQQLGSEWGRDCYPNTWVEYALHVHDRLQAGGYTYHFQRGLSSCSFVGGEAADAHDRMKRHVVISDVRFENEVHAIKDKGGEVIRLLRGQGLEGDAGMHRSEQELLGIDPEEFAYVMDNRQWTINYTEQQVIGLLKELPL